MIKQTIIKIGLIFGVSAFLLSMLIGLIAGAHFGWMLLRALICSIVFAGVGIGIYFIYTKFLALPNEDREDEIVEDNSNAKDKGASSHHVVDLESPADESDDYSAYMDLDDSNDELGELENSITNLDSIGSVDLNDSDMVSIGNNMSTETSDLSTSTQRVSPVFDDVGASEHEFPSNVTLNDIGGPDAGMADYAKAVRTMLKKDE